MSVLLKIGVSAAVLVSGMTGIPGFEGTLLGASEAVAGGGYYKRRRHHHDDFDFGDAVVGAVVLGGLFAVLSSASRKQEAPPPPPLPPESGWEPSGDWNQDADISWQDRNWNNRTAEERAAISACAREADDLGSRYGREARVREIGAVDRQGGEYRVKGFVDIRGGTPRADDARDSQEFICYVLGGRISDFRFLEGYAAR